MEELKNVNSEDSDKNSAQRVFALRNNAAALCVGVYMRKEPMKNEQ